ncbi:hypothetical protein EEB11_08325 [Pseudotabrizicola sediminis]|uniref:Phage terminase large subunit GpA ATPase domain-containing protein n=1 Tax=Pseudotabrizicola sediminis TaxID=2486418 RepID=A0ABY2KMZ9_9RHOB|nr:hypothetical protein EEB11_08325 [Pseudotabrizicola sediminis]
MLRYWLRATGPTTLNLAKGVWQQRFDPRIEESPDLRALVLPCRSRDAGNTILGKRFPGGQLILAGANCAAGLRSMPARSAIRRKSDRPKIAKPLVLSR